MAKVGRKSKYKLGDFITFYEVYACLKNINRYKKRNGISLGLKIRWDMKPCRLEVVGEDIILWW